MVTAFVDVPIMEDEVTEQKDSKTTPVESALEEQGLPCCDTHFQSGDQGDRMYTFGHNLDNLSCEYGPEHFYCDLSSHSMSNVYVYLAG